MPRTSPKPPPVLASARVLEYAVLDDSISYSGHSGLFVGGKELGPVPRLAICQAAGEDEVLLNHCSRRWDLLGVAAYPSVIDAKNHAERIYPGLWTHWINAEVTEEEAERYLDEIWSGEQCSFCGKRPDQVERIGEKNGLRICDSCVAELYKMMFENSQGQRRKRSLRAHRRQKQE